MVENLCKSYGGVKPAQDISFCLRRGHVHALIGPNGAGKSTLINMLSGVVLPDNGVIRYRGADIAGARPHAICTLGVAAVSRTCACSASCRCWTTCCWAATAA